MTDYTKTTKPIAMAQPISFEVFDPTLVQLTPISITPKTKDFPQLSSYVNYDGKPLIIRTPIVTTNFGIPLTVEECEKLGRKTNEYTPKTKDKCMNIQIAIDGVFHQKMHELDEYILDQLTTNSKTGFLKIKKSKDEEPIPFEQAKGIPDLTIIDMPSGQQSLLSYLPFVKQDKKDGTYSMKLVFDAKKGKKTGNSWDDIEIDIYIMGDNGQPRKQKISKVSLDDLKNKFLQPKTQFVCVFKIDRLWIGKNAKSSQKNKFHECGLIKKCCGIVIYEQGSSMKKTIDYGFGECEEDVVEEDEPAQEIVEKKVEKKEVVKVERKDPPKATTTLQVNRQDAKNDSESEQESEQESEEERPPTPPPPKSKKSKK